jgi:hypothetical protein
MGDANSGVLEGNEGGVQDSGVEVVLGNATMEVEVDLRRMYVSAHCQFAINSTEPQSLTSITSPLNVTSQSLYPKSQCPISVTSQLSFHFR